MERLGVTAGALTALAIINDTEGTVTVVIDSTLLEAEQINVHPLVTESTGAVLVAEELFVSGCRLLISITSAGQILPLGPPPYVVLLERALRDEGTSYHYLPPSRCSMLRPELRAMMQTGWDQERLTMPIGASWTTDAPFRETATAIAAYRDEGIVAVEMEAAALYALAEAKQYAIICFAHVTNQMAQQGDDFEKGPDQGSQTALAVIARVVQAWAQQNRQ